MNNEYLSFILLCSSLFLLIFIAIKIIKTNNKEQMHYFFIALLSFFIIWNLGQLLEVYTRALYGKTLMWCVNLYFFGLCFVPVTLFFIGLVFVKDNIKLKITYLFFLIPPITSYLMLLTNDYHHLFFIKYSHLNSQLVYGDYFIFHVIFSYIYIIFSFCYLIFFFIKKSGLFSKQSLLIFLGILIPFIANLLTTFKVVNLPTYFTVITFTLTVACFSIAIFKYQFLDVVPIAMDMVINYMPDAFVILDKHNKVLGFNQSFLKMVERNEFVKGKEIFELFKSEIIIKAIEEKRNKNFELDLGINGLKKYFRTTIKPIVLKNNTYVGTIIFFANIDHQKQLFEQERLASLGQLISGISHNLKSPIMSVAGGIMQLEDLAQEVIESADDAAVTKEDYKEIGQEMQDCTQDIRPYLSYMSEIISAVKEQAVQFNASTTIDFSIDSLIERIKILMKYEIRKNRCHLAIDNQVDLNAKIKGNMSSLVQVVNNLIVNAIYAYEGKEGEIQLNLVKANNKIIISVQDFGCGMPPEVQNKLFKEMITTKGANGTGIGLYMSYSTIKGKFKGDFYFKSKLGEGTTFVIEIPEG